MALCTHCGKPLHGGDSKVHYKKMSFHFGCWIEWFNANLIETDYEADVNDAK